MNDSFDDDDDEDLFPGWLGYVRYPAMLGGAIAGQLLGIGLDAAIGSREFFIPLACTVVIEALVGSFFGASRGLPRLDAKHCVRVSITYSLVLLAISAPLLLWVGASHMEGVPGGVGLSFLTPFRVAAAIVVLAVATAFRAALMRAFVRFAPLAAKAP